VKEYSSRYDFALNINEFIQSFINNGILHEREDRIQFSINFIQNYLLAERLASEPVAAERYFNPSLTEVDFGTFELYAEIGLSKNVLEDILRRLNAHVSRFSERVGATDYSKYIEDRSPGSYKNSGHYLVNGQIKPSLLMSLERSINYQRRVEKAAKDLIGTDSNLEGKQKILDLCHRAAEEASVKFVQDPQNEARDSIRSEIARDWMMAIVLLGSAAEELGADVKRKLASEIVQLAALISNDWLCQIAKHDFQVIKSNLVAELLENERNLTNQIGEKDAVKFVDMVVSMVEMQIYSMPFDSLISTIADNARNKVLFESVKNVIPNDIVEELFFSLWKMELRDLDGFDAFKSTLTRLPKDKFLRMLVATYLVNRAYWYRGSETGRGIFASAVDATLKPLKLKIPVERTDTDFESD
jgi:hypothetical protein